jgi:Protein of unknown function (DUF501)
MIQPQGVVFLLDDASMRFRGSVLVMFALVPSRFCRTTTIVDGFSSSSSSSSSPRIQQDDRQIVQEQLGYLPINFLCVSATTERGTPIAIKTYPLLLRRQRDTNLKKHNMTRLLVDPRNVSSLSTPFPTHYWLTCPSIARAIGEVRDVT